MAMLRRTSSLAGSAGSFCHRARYLSSLESEAGKEEAGLTGGPAVPGVDVRLARPFGFVGKIGIHELDGLMDVMAIGCRKIPQIIFPGRKHLAESDHVIELENGIAVGLGAGKFAGEAAVVGHLLGEKYFSEAAAALGEIFLVVCEFGEHGHLQPEGNGVVVGGVGFVVAVFTRGHPSDIVGKPFFKAFGNFWREGR